MRAFPRAFISLTRGILPKNFTFARAFAKKSAKFAHEVIFLRVGLPLSQYSGRGLG
jgi:hypothetical protein